jgi:hypothetical protein
MELGKGHIVPYLIYIFQEPDMKVFWLITGLCFLAGVSIASIAMADDMDDGISKYTDDSISKSDQVFQSEKNISFIKMKAKAAASGGGGSKASATDTATAATGGNINSVLVGAGSKIRDIYIIDEGHGKKTVVTDR